MGLPRIDRSDEKYFLQGNVGKGRGFYAPAVLEVGWSLGVV
jgi:hypothetical protein